MVFEIPSRAPFRISVVLHLAVKLWIDFLRQNGDVLRTGRASWWSDEEDRHETIAF